MAISRREGADAGGGRPDAARRTPPCGARPQPRGTRPLGRGVCPQGRPRGDGTPDAHGCSTHASERGSRHALLRVPMEPPASAGSSRRAGSFSHECRRRAARHPSIPSGARRSRVAPGVGQSSPFVRRLGSECPRDGGCRPLGSEAGRLRTGEAVVCSPHRRAAAAWSGRGVATSQ